MAESVQGVYHPPRGRKLLGRAAWHVFLILGAIVVLFPFYWMFSTAIKGEQEIFAYPPHLIPYAPQWDNFLKVMSAMPFAQFILNSFTVSIIPAIGNIIACSLGAYVFARKEFPGREVLFTLLLVTLMIPFQVTLIPTYVLMLNLGWLNTLLPMIVPGLTGGAFGIFLLRQFFLTIPQDIFDAAKMDGCTDFDIYWRILMPLSKPALATLGIFIFMLHWNDLLRPVIYLTDYNNMTLTVGLAFFKGQYRTEWSLLMAGAVLSMLPILLLYIVAQRYFEEGMLLSGVKG